MGQASQSTMKHSTRNTTINFSDGNLGDPEWYDTGVEETGQLRSATLWRGFKIAASEGTVYVGKRDGHLMQSLDGGDTWNDITSSFPLPVAHFEEIIFAGSTIYIATDKGGF